MTVTEVASADGGRRRGVGLNLLRSEPRDLRADLHLGTDRRPYLDPDARTYDVVPYRNPHGIPPSPDPTRVPTDDPTAGPNVDPATSDPTSNPTPYPTPTPTGDFPYQGDPVSRDAVSRTRVQDAFVIQ